ncbi:MAG: hypothetical protein IJI58_04115 [Bacilli bacterium]|nr:hypothetical protein [Bacilli bacterium]
MKKKHSREKFIAFKLFVSIIYLIIITILFVCSYRLFQEKNKIIPWSEVESVDDYTYIDISRMSEKFAYYKDTNVGIHFVIEKEDTGLWHTYLIAINENSYDKYKDIIDYTYERTKEEPKSIRVYGYPVIVDDKVKNLAIKNIPNFVPAENEVAITKDNYNEYLTNSYLDTTKPQKDKFSVVLCISLFLLFTVIVLLISTLFLKDENYKKKKKKQKKGKVI